MKKTVAVKPQNGDVAQKLTRPSSTLVYMSDDLIRRLGSFMQDKYAGRQHMRSSIIVQAVEKMLKEEGY